MVLGVQGWILAMHLMDVMVIRLFVVMEVYAGWVGETIMTE